MFNCNRKEKKLKTKKFRIHLDSYQVDYPIQGQWRLCNVHTYYDGVELELWKLTEHKNSAVIHKKIKNFDFADMLLMNETINKIVGRKD
jgi:hypothetical protein